MLVLVDFGALTVGFLVELLLVLLGEVAVVLGHISLFVVLQTLLALFQVGSLPRRQLVVLDAVGNAVLLVLFALIDLIDPRMAGINLARAGAGSVAVLGLSRGSTDSHQTTHCQD